MDAAAGTVITADVQLGAIWNTQGFHSAGVNLTNMESEWSDIAFRETVYVSLVKTTTDKLLARVLVGQLGGSNQVIYETLEVPLPAGEPWFQHNKATFGLQYLRGVHDILAGCTPMKPLSGFFTRDIAQGGNQRRNGNTSRCGALAQA